MPLPASGIITLADLAAEFGGTAPHSLSEYYRNGGLVPDTAANANVPTSGAISLSNFYGAAASNLNPDPVNWTDTSAPRAVLPALTNGQTISGITEPITLTASLTGYATLRYSINEPSNLFTIEYTGGFTVNNGDVVRWGATSQFLITSGVVTIVNASTGLTLDTYNYTITA